MRERRRRGRGRGERKGVRAGFPRVQRKEKDGERKVPHEGGTRCATARDTKRQEKRG